MARIELVRSGGFAGMTLRAAVDTATEPDTGWYDEELATLDLPLLAEGAPGAAGPDRFHYAVTVVDDSGASYRLEYGEATVPERLRPLVARLEQRARGR